MAIKRASETRTWRDTPTGARYFLAEEIEAALHNNIVLPERKDEIPSRRMIELILMQLQIMLHHSDPQTSSKTRHVLRVEIEQPDR